jgi:integrase
MAYQRGCIRKVPRKNGEMWVLRFRENRADGIRREKVLPIGLVRDLPRERDAWREVDRRGILVQVNAEDQKTVMPFDALAEFYIKADLGDSAVRPKSSNTVKITTHLVRHYLMTRWGASPAEAIAPLDIQRWLASLHTEQGLSWPSVSKIRATMSRIYRIGLLHEKVAKNPVQHVQTRSRSDYRPVVMRPDQTLAILKRLEGNPLHHTLVITTAATALRASEILALRWHDVRWEEQRIRVSKRWAGGDGETKTEASDGYVPMHGLLMAHLHAWRCLTPYANEEDFVFPSLKMNGKVPLSASIFVKTHLRSAAIASGMQLAEGQRFGLHNLRHSLSTWLINKAKVDPKIVQGILRHSRVQVTLDLYTQEDSDETRAAQGRFMEALGMSTAIVQ